MAKPDNKWKTFERLVAAIHIAEQQGARVTWNEKIKGRQFDVTIRFRFGLYEYLTVIECKDYEAPVPVKEVEAFVTKSRGVGADKAVMVSSSGFQAGGKEVARRDKVELYTLDLINELPENLISDELIHAVNVYNVKFKPHKGKEVCLFDRDGSLEYLLRRAEIFLGDEVIYPARLVQDYLAGLTEAIGHNPRKAKIPLAKGSKLLLPDLDKPVYVSSLSFTYKLVTARQLVTARPSASVLAPQYKLENELTGQCKVIKSKDVALGFDTKLTPGRYYHIPKIGCSYYCVEIDNGMATFILLECYRDGNLVQVTFTQAAKYEKYYVEVTDKEEINRLSKIHSAYLNRPERPPDLPPAKAAEVSNVVVRYDEASNLTVVEALIKKEER